MNRTQTVAFKPDMIPGYEENRIKALNRYRIANTVPEEVFDHYVQMATLIFRIPAAIIAFVDKDTVHYKASTGIGRAKTVSRFGNTCAETVEIGDTHITHQTNINQQPSASLSIQPTYKYYVGTPIVTRDGYPIGCLSLLDHKTHKFRKEQLITLKIVASAVMDAIEERLTNLREMESRQWLLKVSQEGIWEWDFYHDRIDWNHSFSTIFGYFPQNDTHRDLNFWCNRFAAESHDQVQNAMQSFNLNGEYIFKKADDTPVRVLVRSVIIRDDLERPAKIIGSMLDINERAKNEETNLRANIELMRNKDEFINIASHEIKTPISIIKSYSQIIRREAERNTKNANLIMYADRIQKQNDKLSTLVENLLDISRINSGKMVINPETFDFIKLLEQTLDELDIETASHNIEKHGDAPLFVYADKFRIGQVLTNLITNAVKYSPGANKVIVRYDKNVKNNTAVISVEDFGKGIAKADQDKLFQKFHRIVNLNETHIAGTGLGLNIAREIIRLHGRDINLDSELGKGSVFSFTLQLSPGPLMQL
ncbi:ATP-binding protein [Mucilaginibacter sp. AW1-3]